MKKFNHIEVSEHNTVIVSSASCPLTEETIYDKKQIRFNTVCCKIEGQGEDYICPAFYGAVLNINFKVDCRR